MPIRNISANLLPYVSYTKRYGALQATENLISKKEKILIEAIIAFEQKANQLIGYLAYKYDLNLEEEHPFGKLITRKNDLWKGSIKENWNYQFHGDACKFENSKSGQLLDVKINRKENYGTISDFYLLKFVETTDTLSYVLDEINTSESFYKIIAELENKELIIDIDKSPFTTRILNKEKLKNVL